MRLIGKNKAFIDWYSVIHMGSGIFIGIGMKLLHYRYGWFTETKTFILTGVLILILWEIFEITLRYIKRKDKQTYKWLLKFLPGHIFLREGGVNIISDIIFGTCGLLIIYLIF